MAHVSKTLRLGEVKPYHVAAYIDRIEGSKFDRLAEMWEKKKVQFLALYYDSSQVGGMAISVERDGADKWLIVHGLAADLVDGVDITDEVFDRMIILSKLTGCEGVRCWTERTGLKRKLEKRGAKARYVMEIKTDGI